MRGVGVDFGTSNSSVAVYDGERLQLARLESGGPAPEITPTALYLDRKLTSKTGRAAIARYVSENAGRLITLSREPVGEIHLSVALVTPILVELARSLGEDPDPERGVYVGRPIHYEGRGEHSDRIAAERMRESCSYAGLSGVRLYPEPIAAALSYLHQQGSSEETALLTFDFGGGTLDLCVLRARGEHFETLSTHGASLGGDGIDRMLYRRAIFPALGEDSIVHRPIGAELRACPFPFERFAERLLNWPLAYELNRTELRELMVQGMREGGETARRLSRLYELVTRNRAFEVFEAIERAKIELSTRQRARIEHDDLDLSIELTRRQLERWLEPMIAEIRGVVEIAIERAGLSASDIDVVVRTGGSSRIPAIRAELERTFPGRVVDHDPFTSIAAGLAIASYRGLHAS